MADILLFCGFLIALVGFSIPALFGIVYTVKRRWSKRRAVVVSIVFIISVLINPFAQVVFLEPLDTRLNRQWRHRAEELNIIGKTPDEIRRLFGEPAQKWTRTPRKLDRDGNVTWQGETYTRWKYRPLRCYWLGSGFEVFFVDGRVRDFEANDD